MTIQKPKTTLLRTNLMVIISSLLMLLNVTSVYAYEGIANYYPFGEVRTGGVESKFLFTGKEKDLETGLYYYGARYYNPVIRRWTQPDILIPDVYDPQSLNHYSYVLNNPVKYKDPEGNVAVVDTAIAYLVGSFWGIGEYAVGQYMAGKPIDLNSAECRQHSMETGVMFAAITVAVPVIVEVMGAGPILSEAGSYVGSKAGQAFGAVKSALGIGGKEAAEGAETVVEDVITRAANNPAKFLKTYNRGMRFPNSGKIVLGSGDAYIKKAAELKANCLDIEDPVWTILENSGKAESIMKQSLDEAIERGDEIKFATLPEEAGKNFKWELKYLEKKGFTILKDRAVRK